MLHSHLHWSWHKELGATFHISTNLVWCTFAKNSIFFFSFPSSDSYAWLECTKIAISWNFFCCCCSVFVCFSVKIGYSIPVKKAIASTLRRAFDALWLCVPKMASSLFYLLCFPFTCSLVAFFFGFLPQRLALLFFSRGIGSYFIEIKLWGLYQSQKKIYIFESNSTAGGTHT